MAKRIKQLTIIFAIFFCALLLIMVVGMNIKATNDSNAILGESIKSQLLSISVAAREMIDVEAFISYNSLEDTQADAQSYNSTLSQLRTLAEKSGAEYIYALKYVDNECVFIFDTDTQTDTRFVEYEIHPVHLEAFLGKDSADVLNVSDAYGQFNTGAVPIFHDGDVVGIVSTDIEDVFFRENQRTAGTNIIILVIMLIATFIFMVGMIFMLFGRVRIMQDRLEYMAHYDSLTHLPNRQYLVEYLGSISKRSENDAFALLFLDLDGFKKVNDNAGHDAGDELLCHIADYIRDIQANSKSFRPSAGMVNVTARVGGDEFIIVLPNIESAADAEEFAKKVLEGFINKTIDRYIEKYDVGISIGIALYPQHTENYHVLIKYADIAMYNSKKRGKNGYSVYNETMYFGDRGSQD